MTTTPALLGGPPVRPQGVPEWPLVDPEIDAILRQVAADGSWGRYHGPHCDRLVEKLRELHQCEHVLLTCSGTAAVELALRAAGVGAGHEVILSAYDFKANFTNIALLGATPVLVDIREPDGQIDVTRISAALSSKSKALLVSHLHGSCVDMSALMNIARERGLTVVEDICQMPGATVQGRIAGTWGDIAVMSFGGSKTLTAGRGGAVLTNHSELAQRIRLYTQRGNEAYPLSEIQAALLIPQLEKLEKRHSERSRFADALRSNLEAVLCLRPFARPLDGTPDYYKLGFWYETAELGGLPRDRFCAAMRAEGIPLDPGFRALHTIHARKRFRAADELPVAGRLDDQVVVLHHPVLLEGNRGIADFRSALDKIGQHATLLASQGQPSK